MYKNSQIVLALYLLCGAVGLAHAAGNANLEATRVINSSGIIRMVKATSQTVQYPCIDKNWKKSVPEVRHLFVSNFTIDELRSLANFFESPLGSKYITAFETQYYNSRHPEQTRPLVSLSDAEQNEVKQFYETPAGKKYLNSPEAKIITDATIMIGVKIGVACPRPQ